jgi:ABC-2 type transport system ATP-binding protein
VIATFEGVAKWYGEVIGLIDVSVDIEPGVTGLLGPNGAGKSTFLKLLTGQLRPSQGRVRLLECDPFSAHRVHRNVGFCPEPDAFYDDMSGLAFVNHLTRLQGFGAREAKRRALEAIDRVGLGDAMRRKIRTYSKGMRQRVKLAQAIAHEPEVLVLDEPLTGMDPVGRRDTVKLIRDLGESGSAVLVSSHVLHEVQEMTSRVVLLYRGRVRAVGSLEEIRAHLTDYPHKILLRSPQARELARVLLAQEAVVAVRLDREHNDLLHLETHDPDALYESLPELVLERGLLINGLGGEDLSLGAIFEYLVS